MNSPSNPPVSKHTLDQCAAILEEARKTATPVPPLTKTIFQSESEFSLRDAYQVHERGLALRKNRGEKMVGYKMGFTSRAKMEQMGLHTPIYGTLFDTMRVTPENGFRLKGFMHPKIEPEIAFITSRELRGKVSQAEARAACEFVVPALEILDSRFKDFKYFSLPDVVADNASSCAFILGTPISLVGRDNFDLKNIKVTLEEDGKPVHEAYSNAALGDPVISLCELSQLLWDQKGQTLPAGSIVLTGALTAAIPLRPGQKVRGVFQGFEDINLQVFES